jgi:hypothetical protein
MFVSVGEYFHENDYEFVEIKPQILTCLTNLESNFTSRFSIPSLFSAWMEPKSSSVYSQWED